MEKIIITAKTYDDAVTKALIELGTTQDNLDIKVLDAGTNGLFGIFGAKPCKIEVSVIQRVDDFELLKRENKLHSEQLIHSLNSISEQQKEKPKADKKTKPDELTETSKEARIPASNTQKTEERAKKEVVLEEKDTTSTDEESALSIVPVTEEEASVVIKTAENFVTRLLKTMNFDVQITSRFDYTTNEIFMLMNSEEDMGIIIGKRGQTLDSIQYITSLVVNKSTSRYIRVKLDAQGYRGKRRDKLETLANSVAVKVKRFRKPVSLEPMNPYERRIIHSALQNHPYITTRSEGEEPNRFITIMPKNHFSKNRFHKNTKFRKSQDRSYRGAGEHREKQE